MAIARRAAAEPDDASRGGRDLNLRVEYRLEPIETGTRFTQVSELEWKKHGTFARGVRSDVRGQLRAFKRLLED